MVVDETLRGLAFALKPLAEGRRGACGARGDARDLGQRERGGSSPPSIFVCLKMPIMIWLLKP